jgi:L-alanine-DL-glutamate epimerase-like enolase superfamily enzyme
VLARIRMAIGKAVNVPVHQLLGGASREGVLVYGASISSHEARSLERFFRLIWSGICRRILPLW